MSELSDRDKRRLTRTVRPGIVIAVLAFGGLVASFMQTIILPIQSELPELLNANRDDTAWVVTITLLSAAIFTPISGRLGDLYGKRRIALALLAFFVLGSVIAALGTGITAVIIGRGLQGLVFGLVPLGISILRDVLHPNKLGGAVALMSATLGVGGALGLPVSAYVSENFDWHVLFWMSAVLGLIEIVLIWSLVPVSTLRTPGRFDLIGAFGLGIALSGILIAVSRGNEWGWASAPTLAFGLVGIAILLGWGVFELRSNSPLVDLRVAARPAVLLTNLASLAMGFALFGSNIALPQLLELPAATGVGLGLSLIVASLVLMPSGLVMMVMSPIAARLSRAFGARLLLVVGALLIAVSYVLALLLHTELWQIFLVNVFIGLGIGLGYAAMPTLIMQAVPASETAAANGLNALMRSLGTSFAAAIIGAILAQTTSDFNGTAVPTEAGFNIVFVVGGTAAIASAVLAFLIPRARPADEKHPSLP